MTEMRAQWHLGDLELYVSSGDRIVHQREPRHTFWGPNSVSEYRCVLDDDLASPLLVLERKHGSGLASPSMSVRIICVYHQSAPASFDFDAPLEGQPLSLPLCGPALDNTPIRLPNAVVILVREDILGTGVPTKVQTKHRMMIEFQAVYIVQQLAEPFVQHSASDSAYALQTCASDREAVLSRGSLPPRGAAVASADPSAFEGGRTTASDLTDGMIAPDALGGHMILNGLNVPEIDSPSPGAVPPATRETCLPNDPTPLISGVDWLELACFDLTNSVGSMEPCPSSREGIPGITLTEPTPMATDDAPIDLEALMSVFCTKTPSEITPMGEAEAILGLYNVLLSEPQQPQSIETINTPHSQFPEPTSAEVLPSAPEANTAQLRVPRRSSVQHSVQANPDRSTRMVRRTARKDKRHRWLHDRDCGLDPASRKLERVLKQNRIAMDQLSLFKLYKSRKWNAGASSTESASVQRTRLPDKSDHAVRKGPDGTQSTLADKGAVCIFRLRKRAFDPSQIPTDFVDLTQEDD